MKTTQSKTTVKNEPKSKSSHSSKPKNNGHETFPEEGLGKLFVEQLKDIYWAEKALVKEIPKMLKKASSSELIATLEEHLAVTQEQVTRVEDIFVLIDEKAQTRKCEAMEGLIKEAEGFIEEAEEGMVRDAAIICSAQKIEHYEIATYGTLASFARTLGYEEVSNMLEEILNEEKDADQVLSEVAEEYVNVEAAHETY